MVEPFLWSCVEPCIGIVTACMLTLRPLLRRLFPRLFTCSKRSGGTYGTTGSHSGFRAQNGEFYQLQDKASLRPAEDEIKLTNETEMGAPKLKSGKEEGEDALYSISVRRDIEWSESTVSAERV